MPVDAFGGKFAIVLLRTGLRESSGGSIEGVEDENFTPGVDVKTLSTLSTKEHR